MKRKLVEGKLYAERRYVSHKKYKHYIRTFYNWLKIKYYSWRLK